MSRTHSDGADGEYLKPAHGGAPRFYSYADLEKRYGKSRVTLWRWIRAGLLPTPYVIGPNSVGFKSQEIEAHDAKLKRKTYTVEVGPAE